MYIGNAVVFLKKEIHWPDRASEFYICLPCVVVYWPRAIGQWLLSNPETAKQIAIQFADRPTCYEIHTHLAVKLTVVCGRISTSLLQTAATGSERVR